jgi:hypothetical protein
MTQGLQSQQLSHRLIVSLFSWFILSFFGLSLFLWLLIVKAVDVRLAI